RWWTSARRGRGSCRGVRQRAAPAPPVASESPPACAPRSLPRHPEHQQLTVLSHATAPSLLKWERRTLQPLSLWGRGWGRGCGSVGDKVYWLVCGQNVGGGFRGWLGRFWRMSRAQSAEPIQQRARAGGPEREEDRRVRVCQGVG